MNIVFAISEASRPGEPSVVERVCERINGVELAVPYTTRLPHGADDDGFIFTSQDVFERMIANDEFLEQVEVLGHRYGTPHRAVQDAQDNGDDLLVRVDEHGVLQIKQKLADAVSILIDRSWSDEREHASHSRVDERLLYHRLLHASEQSARPSRDKYDYAVVEGGLEEVADQVIAIIRSERSRRS